MSEQKRPQHPSGLSLPAGGLARPVLSRRRFIEHLMAAGAVTAGGSLLAACSRPTEGGALRANTTTTAAQTAPKGNVLPGAVEGRVLVIVDLLGGNDGLSTLVPAGDPNYYDLRPNLAVPDTDVLALDDEVGLHPSLAGLHARGITTIEGVGPVDGDMSHFAMTERWQRGDAAGKANQRTGFLGRLTDALDDGSPLVGVSLGGPSPHLTNEAATTMSLDGANDLWFLEPTDWSNAIAYQDGLAALDGGDDPLASLVTSSYDQLSDLAAEIAATGGGSEIDWELPMIQDGGGLGQQLHLAADLVAADVGVKVIYASTGSFDTHSGHQWQQEANLSQVDAAVDGFLGRAEELGFDDQVLVATISEFGRRVEENGNGLDHGSASTMLLAGPVENARLGERSPLDSLDEDGNLQVNIGFDRYLATLAEEWLGVEAASVLPDSPEPLGIF